MSGVAAGYMFEQKRGPSPTFLTLLIMPFIIKCRPHTNSQIIYLSTASEKKNITVPSFTDEGRERKPAVDKLLIE